MTNDFDRKTVIITGAGKGNGRACTQLLCDNAPVVTGAVLPIDGGFWPSDTSTSIGDRKTWLNP